MVSRLDIITQLQDELNVLATEMFRSLGQLQQDAEVRTCHANLSKEELVAQKFDTFKPLSQAELEAQAKAFAKEVGQRCRNIDTLLGELAGDPMSEAEQLKELQRLEQENLKAGDDLAVAVANNEQVLESVRSALRTIADEHIGEMTSTQPH